jgi:hypothetical protein
LARSFRGVGGCIDTWSPDLRYMATEVTIASSHRILIADLTTGTGRLLTSDGMVGQCPLWSPDGRWVAFTEDQRSGADPGRHLDRRHRPPRRKRRHIGGDGVAGPNTWSEDGPGSFHDGQRRIWRATSLLAQAGGSPTCPEPPRWPRRRTADSSRSWSAHPRTSDGTCGWPTATGPTRIGSSRTR